MLHAKYYRDNYLIICRSLQRSLYQQDISICRFTTAHTSLPGPLQIPHLSGTLPVLPSLSLSLSFFVGGFDAR